MYLTTFHRQLLSILAGQLLGKQCDIKRIFVRDLHIIHMTLHSHLMTVEIRISYTGILGVNFEAVSFNIRAKLLVEL